MSTKTTVVIPNWNGKEYLRECLDSLYEQGGVPIIVVDNGSNDGSVELLEQCYPEVSLIRLEKNEGFCKASNLGMQAAQTEYVFLLNNDTRVDKNCIPMLEAVLDGHKRTFSVQARLLSMKEPDRIDDAGDLYCALGWAFALGKGKEITAYNKPAKVFAACGGAVLYRKSMLDEIGMLDENHFAYLEDIDLGYRALIYGYENRMEPGAIVYHAGSATSGSRHNSFKVELSAQNSIYLIAKNMPILQILINLPFLLAGILVKAAFFLKKGLGKAYFAGLAKGIRLSLSTQGREHKVRFNPSKTVDYVKIQVLLWINTIRRVAG